MAISSSSLTSKISPTIRHILLRRLPTATTASTTPAINSKPLLDLNSNSSGNVPRRENFNVVDSRVLGRYDWPIIELDKIKMVGSGDGYQCRGKVVVDDDNWVDDCSSDELDHVESDSDDDEFDSDFDDDDDDVCVDEDQVLNLMKRE